MAALQKGKKIKESKDKMRQIEFTFHAPESKQVYIAGTFNDWDTKSMPMKKGNDGTWRITVKLSPGNHEYKFFVNGAWAEDIPGARLNPNPFGTNNCVIGVE